MRIKLFREASWLALMLALTACTSGTSSKALSTDTTASAAAASSSSSAMTFAGSVSSVSSSSSRMSLKPGSRLNLDGSTTSFKIIKVTKLLKSGECLTAVDPTSGAFSVSCDGFKGELWGMFIVDITTTSAVNVTSGTALSSIDDIVGSVSYDIAAINTAISSKKLGSSVGAVSFDIQQDESSGVVSEAEITEVKETDSSGAVTSTITDETAIAATEDTAAASSAISEALTAVPDLTGNWSIARCAVTSAKDKNKSASGDMGDFSCAYNGPIQYVKKYTDAASVQHLAVWQNKAAADACYVDGNGTATTNGTITYKLKSSASDAGFTIADGATADSIYDALAARGLIPTALINEIQNVKSVDSSAAEATCSSMSAGITAGIDAFVVANKNVCPKTPMIKITANNNNMELPTYLCDKRKALSNADWEAFFLKECKSHQQRGDGGGQEWMKIDAVREFFNRLREKRHMGGNSAAKFEELKEWLARNDIGKPATGEANNPNISSIPSEISNLSSAALKDFAKAAMPVFVEMVNRDESIVPPPPAAGATAPAVAMPAAPKPVDEASMPEKALNALSTYLNDPTGTSKHPMDPNGTVTANETIVKHIIYGTRSHFNDIVCAGSAARIEQLNLSDSTVVGNSTVGANLRSAIIDLMNGHYGNVSASTDAYYTAVATKLDTFMDFLPASHCGRIRYARVMDDIVACGGPVGSRPNFCADAAQLSRQKEQFKFDVANMIRDLKQEIYRYTLLSVNVPELIKNGDAVAVLHAYRDLIKWDRLGAVRCKVSDENQFNLETCDTSISGTDKFNYFSVEYMPSGNNTYQARYFATPNSWMTQSHGDQDMMSITYHIKQMWPSQTCTFNSSTSATDSVTDIASSIQQSYQPCVDAGLSSCVGSTSEACRTRSDRLRMGLERVVQQQRYFSMNSDPVFNQTVADVARFSPCLPDASIVDDMESNGSPKFDENGEVKKPLIRVVSPIMRMLNGPISVDSKNDDGLQTYQVAEKAVFKRFMPNSEGEMKICLETQERKLRNLLPVGTDEFSGFYDEVFSNGCQAEVKGVDAGGASGSSSSSSSSASTSTSTETSSTASTAANSRPLEFFSARKVD